MACHLSLLNTHLLIRSVLLLKIRLIVKMRKDITASAGYRKVLQLFVLRFVAVLYE